MSHLQEKTKTSVSTMFERAIAVLRQEHVTAGFLMQFAVYRNYSSGPQDLLVVSPWESKAEHLRNFMDTVGPKGGQGNEAIEVGLQYANAEHAQNPINQIILIGDMPPNTEAEVVSNRKGWFGSEASWKGSHFETPTYYKKELSMLQSQGIPVHAFYVYAHAQKALTEISNTTKGTSKPLDINSDRGAADLTDLVTQAVLKSLGGVKGQALVDAYRKAYCS